MLNQTSKLLATGALGGDLANAVLESFLIHTRNLCEFVQDPKPTKGRAVAAQYFDGVAETWKSKSSKQLDDLRRRADVWLAHVSFARRGQKPRVQFAAVCTELIETLRRFAATAPTKRVHPDLKAQFGL